jgi:hypothetical protein
MIETQAQFLARMEELYKINVDIARRKNSDYTGGRSPFANFMVSEVYGIPMVDAVMVRMSDKMSRIATLKDREAQVTDESILDTLADLANYAMILRMIFENRIELRNARNSGISSNSTEPLEPSVYTLEGKLEETD